MINGIYNDVLCHHGSHKKVDRGWKSNRIVSGCDILIASLMKGEADIDGILYLAIGTGQDSWDETNPTASSAAEQLSNEVFRHPIDASEITFIDQLDQPSLVPTNRLEVRVNFSGAEIVGGSYLSLREFGLFGGDADDTPNSGMLINYVIHPRIDLTTNATLIRQLRITFDHASTVSPGENTFPISLAPQWLRESPLNTIDGVGPVYSSRLSAVNITTIEELSNIETSEMEIDVPPVKLVEFKAKARLVLQTMTELQAVDGLQGLNLKYLMSSPAENFEALSSASIVQIERLQKQLSHLQVSMDDAFVENRETLADLLDN